MEKILKSKYGLLIYSLVCGLAYYVLVMELISNISYSYLLGIFFFPAIVCGAALSLYKTIKNMEQAQEFSKIKSLMIIHIFVILLALSFFVISFFDYEKMF